MAAPVDAARVTTDGSSSATSQSLNLPGSISAGDVLFAIVRTPTDSTSITWPAGWNELEESTADGSNDRTSIAWRLADGTEGATITITLGAAARMAGICWRITGGDTVTASSAATGTTQPNSPTYSPYAAGHTHDTLWLSVGGMENTRTLTTAPSGYGSSVLIANTGGGTTNDCTVFGASLGVTADETEDPGVWALSANEDWTAWTIAVYTAAPRARLTQEPVEAVLLPDTQKVRLTQEPVEAVLLPDTQKVRLTQEPVEAVILPDTQKVRMTQMPVEVVLRINTIPPFQGYIID